MRTSPQFRYDTVHKEAPAPIYNLWKGTTLLGGWGVTTVAGSDAYDHDRTNDSTWLYNDLSYDRSLVRRYLPIPGTKWYVSTFGDVRNSRGKAAFTPANPKNSRPRVQLPPGFREWTYLAELVARVHIGEPPGPDYIVWHRDKDFTNCRVDNLSWVRLQRKEKP